MGRGSGSRGCLSLLVSGAFGRCVCMYLFDTQALQTGVDALDDLLAAQTPRRAARSGSRDQDLGVDREAFENRYINTDTVYD